MKYRELIEEYAAGPALVRAAVQGMTAAQLDAAPIPGKWTTRQVVCHLADFEPVYADRMKRVIAENEPTLFGGDPDVFSARLAYDLRDVEDELLLIESVRRHMAPILRSLDDEDFERRGLHSEAGPVTLAWLLEQITAHVPHHVRFIAAKREALAE
ncbi:MAG: DinB family protein [Pirellulales bacterium]